MSLRRAFYQRPPTDPGLAFCGGTLISARHIVTAAHCLYDIDPKSISYVFAVVGAHYINDTNPVRHQIKSMILHEDYDDDLFLNDIALVEIYPPVAFDSTAMGFVCLPINNASTYPYERMNGTAAGWGRLTENSTASLTLQQVQLPVIADSNEFCKKQTTDSRVQFCAGYIEAGRDTCQGDR